MRQLSHRRVELADISRNDCVLTDSRTRSLLVLTAGFAFGLITVLIASKAPSYSFTGVSVLADVAYVHVSVARAALELCAGWALLVVGAVALTRGPTRFGGLLIAACFGWFIVDWNNPGTRWTLPFTIGLAFSAATAPIVAHAGLAYPTGRLSWLGDHVGLITAYVGGLVLLGIAPALVYDGTANGCDDCSHNLLLVHTSSRLYNWLNQVGVDAGLGWSLALIVLLGLRLLRATAASRPVVWPVVAAAATFQALVAWDFAHSITRGTLGVDSTDRKLWLGEAVALIALAGGVTWHWIRIRRSRAAVARLVVELFESPPPRGLRALLAEAFGDPSLEIAYPLQDGRLVDARGLPTTLEGEVTPLLRGRRQLAVLGHRAGLLVDREVVAAAGLAFENERLQAEAQARLEDLRASRARVVAAGDAERRRLERDLHDGAQQGLVALSLGLRHARSQIADGVDPDRAARLDQAHATLGESLEDLRRLAHGIFPAVLTDEGLAAALETLADETGITIDVSSLSDERLDPAIENAAYYTVVEILRRADLTQLQIEATRSDGLLVLDLESNGVIDDATSLEDRLGALDGTFTIAAEPDRIRIRAVIPCES
jgi:signal transduction histidine kinase